MKTKLLLATSSLLAAAGLAHAAYDLDNGVKVIPTVSAGAQYNDNVFLNQSNKTSDTIWVLSPGVSVVAGEGALNTTNFSYSEQFQFFSDDSNLNANLAIADFSSRFDDGKMKIAIDKALAEADAAHAALKQPPDLKAVYDQAYEHMVTKPANVFRELIPIMVSGLPVIEKLAGFLDEHRDAIEYRGGMPVLRDAKLRPQLEALMQEAVKVSEASAEGKRKLQAMAEGK